MRTTEGERRVMGVSLGRDSIEGSLFWRGLWWRGCLPGRSFAPGSDLGGNCCDFELMRCVQCLLLLRMLVAIVVRDVMMFMYCRGAPMEVLMRWKGGNAAKLEVKSPIGRYPKSIS